MSIAVRIQGLIPYRGRNAFSRLCGINESLLKRYENGAMPGADRAQAIAQAANVPVCWLITGKACQEEQTRILNACIPLSADERALLDTYRAADDLGKAALVGMCTALARKQTD